MTNSVDPDQTAPILISNVRKLFAADDFSRRHFSDAFFLGATRYANFYLKDSQNINKEIVMIHYPETCPLT